MNESWSSEDREVEDSEDDVLRRRRQEEILRQRRQHANSMNRKMCTSTQSSEGAFSEEENTSERSHVEPEMLSSLSAENLQVC